MAEITKEAVIEALKNVYDPEITSVSIVDLGLIYDVQVNDGNVDVKMTLTAQGCGMGPMIADNATQAVYTVPGVKQANVELVWEPPWTPERITEDGKKALGWE